MSEKQRFDSEEFHRTAKIFVDSGEAASPEEALLRLKSFRLGIIAGKEVTRSCSLQSALLTMVNVGARSFLGGVYVSLPTETIRSQIPGFEFDSLANLIRCLGGQ